MSSDDVADAEDGGVPDPRHRDVVRRDGGGHRRRRHRRGVVGGVEPGRPARPLRRGGARDRQPGPRRAAHAGGGPGAGGVRASRATSSTRWPPPSGPGLAGALLVGVSTAKALALVWGVPFVGVNHMEAHLYACFLEEPDLEPPLLVLLVSGGHTMLVSMEDHGRTGCSAPRVDDAVGEAFDKVARFLGPRLPGRAGHRPPGPRGRPRRRPLAPAHARGLRLLPQRAQDGGHPLRASPPRRGHRPTWPPPSSGRWSTCWSTRPGGRRRETGATTLCLGGGVAANSLLRERILDACERGRPAPLPPQPGDVHRQRRHGRRRRLVALPGRRPHAPRRRRPARTSAWRRARPAVPSAAGGAGSPPKAAAVTLPCENRPARLRRPQAIVSTRH